MQLLWFLPSIAYGVMLAVSSGNYFLLASTMMSAAAMLLVRWRMSLQPKLGDSTELRILNGRIWLDDYRLPRGSAFWSREQFDFIFQRLAPQSNLTKQLAQDFADEKYPRDSTNVTIGFTLEDFFRISLSEDGPHAIIVGPTGSGKTELLRILVGGIRDTAPHTELVLIDFKGGAGLQRFAGSAREFVTDHDTGEANRVFDFLADELQRRELGESYSTELVIVIDELAHLLSRVKSAESVLASIAARGRSARMHLVLTNQNLVGVPRALLSNLRLRLLVGQHDPVDAALLGQASKPAPTPEVGLRLTTAQLVGHGQSARQFWFTVKAKQHAKHLAR